MAEKKLDPRLEAGLQAIRDLAEAIVEQQGLEIVEVTLEGSFRRPRVCVYVDGPTGVTLDDCAAISRGISAGIEELEEDPFPGSYSLEVSSPGLDRPFQNMADYRRNMGRQVELHLRNARPGGIEKLVGILSNVDEEGLDLELDDGRTERCSFEEIRKVHRSIQFGASP